MIDLATRVGTLSALNPLPERQFFYYAWPCLDNRGSHGQQISRTQIEELTRLVTNNERPRRSLLRYVFPDAYRGISLAAERYKVDRWSHVSIESYFLIDHDKHLEPALARGISHQIVDLCRVYVGQVVFLAPLQCQLVTGNDNRKNLFNPYNMTCKIGDFVAIHGLTIVDILKPLDLKE